MNWLTSLQPDIIDSWDDLNRMFIENYKATCERPATKHDLARILSGTIKRGPLSKNQKNRLDPVIIKAKRQLPSNPHLVRGYRFSASLEASHKRPRMGNRFSISLEAPRKKPRTRCRFSISLEAGSTITPSPLPRPISPTERRI